MRGIARQSDRKSMWQREEEHVELEKEENASKTKDGGGQGCAREWGLSPKNMRQMHGRQLSQHTHRHRNRLRQHTERVSVTYACHIYLHNIFVYTFIYTYIHTQIENALSACTDLRKLLLGKKPKTRGGVSINHLWTPWRFSHRVLPRYSQSKNVVISVGFEVWEMVQHGGEERHSAHPGEGHTVYTLAMANISVLEQGQDHHKRDGLEENGLSHGRGLLLYMLQLVFTKD